MSRPNRRRAVRAVAPVAGLLAAGLLVWQGSYAAFSATTTSPSNNWAAGSVALTNSSNAFGTPVGTATWASVTNIKPTSTDTRCITVKSTGTLPGTVKMGVANANETLGLGANLQFTIRLMTAGVGAGTVNPATCAGFVTGSTLVTNVALTSIPAVASGYAGWTLAGGTEYAAYQISWTLPNAAPTSVQGGTATADFVWEATNS